MSYTTTDLLSAIARRAFAPAGQLTLTSTEQLAIADEVTRTYLLGDIMSVREEFFVTYRDYAITANQQAYDIPPRSVGMRIREVQYVSGTLVNGVVVGSCGVRDLPRREPEQIRTISVGCPDSFYLQDDQICLYPTPSATTGVLRVYYYLRPSALIATSSAAVVSAINTGIFQATVAAIPNSWATADIFDFSRQDGGQRPYAGGYDLTSSLVSGSTITFASLPTGLRVGDYVAHAGESAVVQLPPEFRDVLAQGVAAEILSDMNQPGADKARATFDKLRQNAQKLLTPRVAGEDRYIHPVNWF